MNLISNKLAAEIVRETARVYAETSYRRPTAGEVTAAALDDAVATLHERARNLARCDEVDSCTAEAIVLRRLADWLAAMAQDDTATEEPC